MISEKNNVVCYNLVWRFEVKVHFISPKMMDVCLFKNQKHYAMSLQLHISLKVCYIDLDIRGYFDACLSDETVKIKITSRRKSHDHTNGTYNNLIKCNYYLNTFKTTLPHKAVT